MLLQELFNSESKAETAYGVEINEESSKTEYSQPPVGLRSIGFVFKADEDGMMDEKLLDLVISYKLTNMEVVIEIPPQIFRQNNVTAKNLIQLANNVDFSIALLPPKHPLSDGLTSFDDYLSIVESFNSEMVQKQNFDKFVAPISNFLEYLMLETLLGSDNPAVSGFKPKDEYVLNNFVKHLNESESDAFKSSIRDAMYSHYGSKEAFEAIAREIFGRIYEKAESSFKTHVERQLQIRSQSNP